MASGYLPSRDGHEIFMYASGQPNTHGEWQPGTGFSCNQEPSNQDPDNQDPGNQDSTNKNPTNKNPDNQVLAKYTASAQYALGT